MKEFTDTFRFIILVLFTAAAAAAGSFELFRIQLVDGSEYYKQSLSSSESIQMIDAPRGQIADMDGELLVSNKSGYNVIVQKAFFPSEDPEANEVVLKAAKLIRNEGLEYEDILPISTSSPFGFMEDREKDIERLRKKIGVQVYATAEECLIAMAKRYSIYAEYTSEEVRTIAGIRYTMECRDFSVANRFVFTKDVPMSAVVRIKESSAELSGIDIAEEAVRVNNVGDVAPHLIGTVGAISAEEYANLRTEGYDLSDTVGKGGIEYAMERTLRGEKGERRFGFTAGILSSDTNVSEPTPGHSIKLTIDSDYQRSVQQILENHITWLNNQTSSQRKGEGANAGAVVVLDSNTGALLAAATAPTYDLLDYIDDYGKVAGGSNAPLTNRAVSGRYRPGSTFKTVTATAALNEGVITQYSTVNCEKYYTYWEDWVPPPECTGWHNRLNVVEALRESCNVFFYDVGRITGIETIARYASDYGLGEEMGLEIGRGRKIGFIASPETFDERGLDWQVGNVIQAAIGQSDTYVTPLQMAAQAMTIANGGTRYKTYMVDSVYDYSFEHMLTKTKPTVAKVITDKTGYTFESVKEGMKEAARFEEYPAYPRCRDYYTSSYLLTDLPHSAAIKTGTPQMTSKSDTGSAFIGFYPADEPVIAFAGFVEHGEYSKLMIKDIIEAYYRSDYLPEELRVKEDPAQELSDTVTGTTVAADEEEYYDDYDYDYYDYEDYDYYDDYEYEGAEVEDAPDIIIPDISGDETENYEQDDEDEIIVGDIVFEEPEMLE